MIACENVECKDPRIRFLYNEKSNAVFKCCYTCFSSRALQKNQYIALVDGPYQEFRDHRDGYYKGLWESARASRAALELDIFTDESFYDTSLWRKLRYDALSKNHGKACPLCGRKPPEVVFHVDHIEPRSKRPDLALDPSNLQILCGDCNLGKSNRDNTNFQSPDGAA